MTPEEKEKKDKADQHYLQCARDMREIVEMGKSQSETMAHGVSNEFVRLEVQIATLLFAIVGLFLKAFTQRGSLNFLGAKIALSVAVSTLIVSLIMGLLHLKREERFLDSLTSQRGRRASKWKDAVEGRVSFDQAKAFHEGSTLGNGPVITSPQWVWILQTIFLGIGVAFLFTLFLMFVFMGGNGTI